MKRVDYDFSIPQRQSIVAIIFLIYKYFKVIVRSLWPIAIALVVGKGDSKIILLWAFIIISILILIYSVADFFRYSFHIDNDELVIEKGVFIRSKTNIPLQRIQTINFEQSILHQLFNVVKLEVDTAGAKGNEFSFSAFDLNKAEALRDTLMEKKAGLQHKMTDNEYPGAAIVFAKEQEIMSLSVFELIRIGITQNHLRSFFLILLFIYSFYINIDDLGIDTDAVVNEISEEMLTFGKIAIAFLILFSIILTFLYSLVRTILNHFQFSLFRSEDGFKIVSGLFNRKQVSAKDKKIQMIEWSDNPLKRMLGIYDVFLKQASSIEISSRHSIIIPGCNNNNLQKIINYYFDLAEWSHLHKFKISNRIIEYKTFYFGIVPAIILLFIFIFSGFPSFSWLMLLWPFIVFIAAKVNFKKWKISMNDHVLMVQHGLFGNSNVVIKLNKIQCVALKQNLFLKRNNLANLSIYTASGKVKIPFLNIKLAQSITNFYLYKVESDNRTWM